MAVPQYRVMHHFLMTSLFPSDRYPDAEHRTPRESFTKQLERICKQLDEVSIVEGRLDFETTDFKKGFRSTIKSVWVLGSYARGALTCGDLDLMVNHTVDYVAQSTTAKTSSKSVPLKKLIAKGKNARVMWGTPTENGANVNFKEAVLIWEAGKDWRAAIASIVPNESARRFKRDWDAIPFRQEQTPDGRKEAAYLLQKHAAEEVCWDFIPLSTIEPMSCRQDADEEWQFNCMQDKFKVLRKMAPLLRGLLDHVQKAQVLRHKILWDVFAKELVVGPVRISTNSVRLDPGVLNKTNLSSMVYLLAPSTRGPNGAWVLNRGRNHPLVTACAEKSLWVAVYPDNRPFLRDVSRDHLSLSAKLIDVYRSEQQAAAAVAALNDEFLKHSRYEDVAENMLVPKKLVGKEILELAGAADVLQDASGKTCVALQRRGQPYCHGLVSEPLPGTAELTAPNWAALTFIQFLGAI